MTEPLRGEIPLVRPEELPEIRTNEGEIVTREFLENNPYWIQVIQNVYGINIDMTPTTSSERSNS